MAKAKKTESTSKPAPKKAAARKTMEKRPAGASGSPMVNTNLAAENAARLLAAGRLRRGGIESAAAKTESGSFKNLKQGIAQSQMGNLNNLLDKSAPADTKRSNVPFVGGKQVGHNQTFGADVNRTGVPRRTGG